MFEDVDSEKSYLLRVCFFSLLVAAALILVVLRLFVKLRFIRNVGKEDYALMVAMVIRLLNDSHSTLYHSCANLVLISFIFLSYSRYSH